MAKTAMDVVMEFLGALRTSGGQAAAEFLTDDFVLHEAPSLPYGGDHVGKEAFAKFADQFYNVWSFDGTARPPYRYIEGHDGKALVVLGNAPVTAVASGRRIDLKASEVYFIRNEKIASIEVYYWDTKELYEATTSAMPTSE